MRSIKILHLYPDRMSIYGDYGNIISLIKRMEWRNIGCDYNTLSIGDKFDTDYDIIFMGGGQDKGQVYVAQDLQLQSSKIHEHFNLNKPILTICGGYQLFGRYFRTSDAKDLPGIGIFDVATKATDTRMIGNVLVKSDQFGELIGFENHSGATELSGIEKPLGVVIKGFGNNTYSKTEGVLSKNAIGTYMHGSFLPKNPVIADYIIEQAVRIYEPEYKLSVLDDELETLAFGAAKKRPQ